MNHKEHLWDTFKLFLIAILVIVIVYFAYATITNKSAGQQGGFGLPSVGSMPIAQAPTGLGNPQRGCLIGGAPWIQVLSPNGGENYTAGQKITVTWTSCNIPASTIITLELVESSPSGIISLGTHVPNSGSTTVTLPSQATVPSMVYGDIFKLDASVSPTLQDESDNLFSINSLRGTTVCTSQSAPSIQVTSPNGGQTYTEGQKVAVTWTSCNVPATANIGVYLDYEPAPLTTDNKNLYSLLGPQYYTWTPNTGSMTITIPTGTMPYTSDKLAFGKYYKILVADGSSGPSDYSDNYLTIAK